MKEDYELLKAYLQNQIDTGIHKIFNFDKDYNVIEFKIGNALSEIEFIERRNNELMKILYKVYEDKNLDKLECCGEIEDLFDGRVK